MVKARYVPDSGDLGWIDFDPHAGREQAGRRPALILTPAAYNEKAGLAVACPVTNQVKGYPFEVLLPTGATISGAVLCDHLKSIDWHARRLERAMRAPSPVMQQVRARIAALLGLST